MKRPEKKECSDENPYNCLECGDEGWVYGYNQAIDDMDKFEPTVEEIARIIAETNVAGGYTVEQLRISKAIHKRLTKE